MKHKYLIFPLALIALLFAACDNNVVSRAEYNALLSERNALEAENDSLHFGAVEPADIRRMPRRG